MEEIYEYVLVNDIDELKKNAIWSDKKRIRVNRMGVFHELDKVTFPQTFKYFVPDDYHCCGDYFPCDKADMAQAINMQICRYENKIEKYKKVLDLLKS